MLSSTVNAAAAATTTTTTVSTHHPPLPTYLHSYTTTSMLCYAMQLPYFSSLALLVPNIILNMNDVRTFLLYPLT